MSLPEFKTQQQSDVWIAMERDGCKTVAEIVEKTGLNQSTVRHMIKRWVMKGYLTSDDTARDRTFAIAKSRVPAFGPPEKRMWTEMRALRQFSVRDVLLTASVEGGEITEKEAKSYIQSLLEYGFLRCHQKARPGHHPARYRLVRDTGVSPPVRKRIMVTIDQNTGQVFLPEAYL